MAKPRPLTPEQLAEFASLWVLHAIPVGGGVHHYPLCLAWTYYLRQAVLKTARETGKAEIKKHRRTKGAALTVDKVKHAINHCEGVVSDAARYLDVEESYLHTYIGNYRLDKVVVMARALREQNGKARPGAHGPKESLSLGAEALTEALQAAEGNVSRAAHRLGISSVTLRHRIKDLNLKEALWAARSKRNRRNKADREAK